MKTCMLEGVLYCQFPHFNCFTRLIKVRYTLIPSFCLQIVEMRRCITATYLQNLTYIISISNLILHLTFNLFEILKNQNKKLFLSQSSREINDNVRSTISKQKKINYLHLLGVSFYHQPIFNIQNKVQQLFWSTYYYFEMGQCHCSQNKDKNPPRVDSQTTRNKIEQPSSIAKPTTTSSRPSNLQYVSNQIRSLPRTIKIMPISSSPQPFINKKDNNSQPIIKLQMAIQTQPSFVCSKCRRSTMQQEQIYNSQSFEPSLQQLEKKVCDADNPQDNKLRQTRTRLKISWQSKQFKANKVQPQSCSHLNLNLNLQQDNISHPHSTQRSQSQMYTLHEQSYRIGKIEHTNYLKNPYTLDTLQEAHENAGQVKRPVSSICQGISRVEKHLMLP